MRTLLTTSIAFFAIFAAGCSRNELTSSIDFRATDQLPTSWILPEIAAVAVRSGETAIDSDVLCWQIMEDSQPLRVESCIVWSRLTERKKPKWRLSHLYRHPLEENQWRTSGTWPGMWINDRDYDHPPSSPEILEFIDCTNWSWDLNEFDDPEAMRVLNGFKYLDGHVRLGIWKNRTGTPFDLPVPIEYLR